MDAHASASVSGLKADPPLTVTPPGALKAQGGPQPRSIDGSTLQPGQSTSYTETLTITGSGRPKLSVEVTGISGGTTVTAQAQVTAVLSEPLAVSVSWLKDGSPLVLRAPRPEPLPDTLRLADADAGEVPQDITAKVIVKNVSGVEQDHVSMNGVPPFSYHTRAGSGRAADRRHVRPDPVGAPP